MDPNEALHVLREWSDIAVDDDAADGLESKAAESFKALDQWLSKGGHVPNAWSRFPNPVIGP